MIAVIGCGNPNRSDDGVGSEVVRALSIRLHDKRVRLLDAGTDGMGVMFAARGCRHVIIVDACRSSSPVGAIFEVPGSELKQKYHGSLTLHDFRWEHALYAGQQMFGDDFPQDVTVLLVEAGTITFGIGLSPPVAQAAEKVASRIEEMVASKLQRGLTGVVRLTRGGIHLTSEMYEAHFAGLDGVILQRGGDDLLIMPVRHAAAGGYLLKRRNARGDRVISAEDFLRSQGIEDDMEVRAVAIWDACAAGLVLARVFCEERERA